MIRFLKGFKFAFDGIIGCLKTERNMRIHFCAGFYVLIFMQFYDLSASQKALIIMIIGSVISAEAINTAIEAAVDLASPETHPLARLAKDAAAGAVLVLAVAAAASGIVVFLDGQKLLEIFAWFKEHTAALAAMIVSIFAWVYFITRPCKKPNAEQTADDNKKDNK